MNNDLYKYLDSIETEMKESQICFFEKWNKIIRDHLKLDAKFQIEKYVDIFGGYWLDKEEYTKMNSGLIKFYDKRVCQGNRIYLRGYDYYQADPLFHMQSENCKHYELWDVFQKKWENYQCIDSFDYLNESMSIENWIGTLGLLEYLFTDLTSVRWFVFRNKRSLLSFFSDTYDEIVKVVESFSETIGEAIACMLRFDFDRVYCLLSERFQDIIKSPLLNQLLLKDFDVIERASIRTMREGDSTVLIYAAYLLKLKPFCESYQLKNIRFLSNAFGAMNIGIILKYLISPVCEAKHSNILYAQHRSEGDFVYDDALINKCCFINPEEQYEDQETEAVFVVDDSICFGKSYLYIKNYVSQKDVYLLPLTLNCNGMRYFRVGLTENDNLNTIIHQSVQWASEVNHALPAFFSFWDFRQTVPEKRPVNDETYCFAMFGSDLLLNHLWKIYFDKIVLYEKK